MALAAGAVAPPVAHRRRRHTISSLELLRPVRQIGAIKVTAAQLLDALTLATIARVAVRGAHVLAQQCATNLATAAVQIAKLEELPRPSTPLLLRTALPRDPRRRGREQESLMKTKKVATFAVNR